MFSIAPYLFQVLDSKEIPQDLKLINGGSFHSYLKNYFSSIKDKPSQIPVTGTQQYKTYVFKKEYLGDAHSVAGLFQTGIYGFESDIYSFAAKKVSHRRKKDEADMLPFNFSFYTPASKDINDRLKGLLLLGRFNTLGIRGIVVPNLIEHFGTANPGLKLKIERYVPASLITSVMHGAKVKKIRLIKSGLPKDLANALSPTDYAKVLDFECVIRPKRRTWFSDVNWALDAMSKKFDPKAAFSLGEFTPDRVKIEMAKGTKVRTVDLSNFGKLSSNINLENVAVGSDGYIGASDWLAEADSLADDIFLSWDSGVPKWNSRV